MNNNSILLNGSFFEEEYQKKIDKLNNLEIKTVYVFDHSINPEIKKLPVYKIMDALSKLDKYDRNFKIGSMVLNIRKREINELMENYLNPLIQYLQQEMRDQKQMIQFRMLVKFLFLSHQKAEFSLKSLISRVLEKKL